MDPSTWLMIAAIAAPMISKMMGGDSKPGPPPAPSPLPPAQTGGSDFESTAAQLAQLLAARQQANPTHRWA